jgi:hypothetical protein
VLGLTLYGRSASGLALMAGTNQGSIGLESSESFEPRRVLIWEGV